MHTRTLRTLQCTSGKASLTDQDLKSGLKSGAQAGKAQTQTLWHKGVECFGGLGKRAPKATPTHTNTHTHTYATGHLTHQHREVDISRSVVSSQSRGSKFSSLIQEGRQGLSPCTFRVSSAESLNFDKSVPQSQDKLSLASRCCGENCHKIAPCHSGLVCSVFPEVCEVSKTPGLEESAVPFSRCPD